MRIGIVGAGGAGLTTAWLLEDAHEVLLFERDARLGGHAETIAVSRAGRTVGVDAGFEFFSRRMFPRFSRLLDLLGVVVRPYPMTATFYTTDGRTTVMVPPLRGRRVAWEMLAPGQAATLLQLAFTLNRARALMESQDTTVTIEAFLRSLPLTTAFRERFLFPFMLAWWCCELDELRSFMAYDVLRYAYMHQLSGLAPARWSEIEGGVGTYVAALARSLRRTQILTGSEVIHAERSGDGYTLRTAGGGVHAVDRLVLATNAAEARTILAGVEGAEAVCQTLAPVSYFRSTIAVHGDRRLMPADERHWGVVNIRHDGRHSQSSVWRPWRRAGHVFKSWVTYEAALPEPLYGLATYWHPRVDAAYFRAQRELRALQGRGGLWIAGMYTHDVDCHESAVVSGVNVARRLAPGSARLAALLAGGAG
jgi:predicted NAD/FAD-binding protein